MNAVVTPSTTPPVMKTIVTKLGNTIVYDFSSDEEDIIQKSLNEENKSNRSNRIAATEMSVIDDTLPLISSTNFPISKEDFDILFEHVLTNLTGSGQTNLTNQFGRSQIVKNKSGTNLNVINGEISSRTGYDMLDSAEVTSKDHLCEIGCSYGKICFMAALCFGMTATGVEIQESCCAIGKYIMGELDTVIDNIGIQRSPDQKLDYLVRFLNCDFIATKNLLERSSVVYFNDFGSFHTITPELKNKFNNDITKTPDKSHIFCFERLQVIVIQTEHILL